MLILQTRSVTCELAVSHRNVFTESIAPAFEAFEADLHGDSSINQLKFTYKVQSITIQICRRDLHCLWLTTHDIWSPTLNQMGPQSRQITKGTALRRKLFRIKSISYKVESTLKPKESSHAITPRRHRDQSRNQS